MPHTAIAHFDDHASAEEAVERLVRSGFAREGVHIEERPAGATDGTMDGVRQFFGRLLGGTDGAPSRAAEAGARGAVVVLVDAVDERQAQRAQTLMGVVQDAGTGRTAAPQQRGPGQDAAQQPQPVSPRTDTWPAVTHSMPPPVDAAAVQAGPPPGGPVVGGAPDAARPDPELSHPPGLRYAADPHEPGR